MDLAISLFAPLIVSAWTDVYKAKFEAARWKQDSKIPHDYVEGNLQLQDDVEPILTMTRT